MSSTLRDAGYFLRLSRPLNLLIAAVTFSLAAYISALNSWIFWQNRLYWQELGLIMVIMATGYWINDVYDHRIDRVNKPQRTWISTHISAKKVITGYLVATFCVLVATLFLPPKYMLLNGGAVVALLLYARYLKRAAIVGNLMVATLSALVVLAGALLYHLKLPLLWGMIFAFGVSLIREVVKDVEDLRGDMQHGLRTFPILMGIGATKRLLAVFYLLFLAAVLLPYFIYPYTRYAVWPLPYLLYTLGAVVPVLLWGMLLLGRARRPTDFGRQSRLLKLLMALGLGGILLLP